MLATVTLATQEGWLGTWIGSTVGMVAADALAIVVGAVLGRKLPEKAIKYGAAAAFAVFGLLLVAEGAEKQLGRTPGGDIAWRRLDFNWPLWILFSSGTTGASRAPCSCPVPGSRTSIPV